MTLETLQLDKKMLEYSISEFRNIPEYVKICEAFAVGAETIQNTTNYLSNMIDKDKAQGVWLDYIGWLVGEIREEYIDSEEFFCVNETHEQVLYAWTSSGDATVYTTQETPEVGDNAYSDVDGTILGTISAYSNNTIIVESTSYNQDAGNNTTISAGDINRLRRFYFPNISSNLGYVSTLGDNLFKRQIDAKIAYNVSKGTREDNIKIIKPLVNADKVIIENYSPMMLKITLYGNNIIKANIKTRIENVLVPEVGIYGDITIYDEISYETIESEINTIVEMSGIEGDYEDYGYIEIDEDLNYILEIE